MEKKPERKWKTLRTLASHKAEPEEGVASVSPSELIEDEPAFEAPEEIQEDEVSNEEVSQIAEPLVPSEEVISIREDRDWFVPESGDSLEAVGSAEESEESSPEEEVAVFENLERSDPFFATAISMRPDPGMESGSASTDGGNRILVAHEVASTSRLIRETLENFTEAEVETTSDPVRAFEMALQKPYRRFFFALQVGELSGAMLYDLISKAYANGRGAKMLAPGVVFIREKTDPQLPPELVRDARVKDTISKPIRIERLLKTVADIFEVRDPTVKGD